MLRRTLQHTLILALALCASGVAPCRAQDSYQQETNQLATLLKWHPGTVVAEIGAGQGRMTTIAAQHVSPSGKVYTTELNPSAFAHLQELAAKDKTIIAVKAGENSTNLPPTCCDSIFMRLVYHHLTRPEEIDASLFQSLKPDGRLAVIDEEPSPGSQVPEGVPKNRVGHGIPKKILISELTAAGFHVETVINDWPTSSDGYKMYCVIFTKTNP